MSPNPLRALPSVHELLDSPRLKRLVERMHPSALLTTARAVLDEVAGEMQAAAAEKTWPSVGELAERIARRVTANHAPGLGPVINATGSIFPSSLGPPPLAEPAVEALAAAARDYAARLDHSDDPGGPACRRLTELTGAEAAFVTGSAAAAMWLTLAELAGDGEIVVGRSDLICRGPDYSLPELARAAGIALHEVGAVNHATLNDFARAVGDWTGALLCVERACLGHTNPAMPALPELVGLARERDLPLVYDLGPASLVDLAPFGVPRVPVVGQSVAAGADVVILTHHWTGAPECGILLGRRAWIERIATHPMAGPLRATPATSAALAAALELFAQPERARHTVPVLQMATASPANLEGRAKRLAPQMAAAKVLQSAEPVETVGPWGGDEWPGSQMPTWQIELRGLRMSPGELVEALRRSRPAVVAGAQDDCVPLDLRSVLPRQDLALVEAVLGLDGPAEPA